MRRNKLNLALCLCVLLATVLACNFSASTANLSSLKISKDKSGSPEASTFGGNDTIYAVAEVSNAPGKTQAKGRLVIEDVEGQPSGPVAGLENTVELPGSGTATFTFKPASSLPAGKYKVEVLMLNEAGEQKDQKSASFTVS